MTVKQLSKELLKKEKIIAQERDELRELIGKAEDLDHKLGDLLYSISDALDAISEYLRVLEISQHFLLYVIIYL